MAKARDYNGAQEMLALMKRAGYASHDAFARACGYARQSSVQRFLDIQKNEGRHLPFSFVQKAASALVGKGQPAITRQEVMAVAGAANIDANRIAQIIERESQKLKVPLGAADRAKLIAAVLDEIENA